MIHQLDQSIRNLLTHELASEIGQVEISFSAPNGDWVSKLGNQPTLNLFLYDVRENPELRRHQWQQLSQAPAVTQRNGNGSGSGSGGGKGKAHGNEKPPADLRRVSTAMLKRTPLMVDCFYMVSAWSAADERNKPLEEHRLLSLCMMALARFPILNLEELREGAPAVVGGRQAGAAEPPLASGFLVGSLANQTVEIRSRLAYHDVLTNPAEVWSALENQMKAAFSYVVTLPIDPWDRMTQLVEKVGVAEFRTGQMSQPKPEPEEQGIDLEPAKPTIDKGAPLVALYRLAGTVWNAAEEPTKPAVALPVTIMEPDIFHGAKSIGLYRRTKTDRRGRFSFQRLLPGEYIIVVGADLEQPLAVDNVIILSSQVERGEEDPVMFCDIEVDLPRQPA